METYIGIISDLDKGYSKLVQWESIRVKVSADFDDDLFRILAAIGLPIYSTIKKT
jgi:hypothetical protein